ncbi:MAG: hypothetical protein LW650_08640 [Planctomycetaceae bacterium]|nr:hypothetical protein [Phycisphaerales bacterium]MCE2653547.1 hypothetical protein [Planctomycetaceae bacterium]
MSELNPVVNRMVGSGEPPPPQWRPAHEMEPTQRLTASEDREVDELSDQLMSAGSVEGRPPTHRERRATSVIVLSLAGCGLLAAGAYLLLSGRPIGLVLGGGVVLALLLAVGGSPVWVSAWRRRAEQASAHAQAMGRLHPDHLMPPAAAGPALPAERGAEATRDRDCGPIPGPT